MTKDEMKNRISMALKDPILQQGFEIICKENAELKEINSRTLGQLNIANGELIIENEQKAEQLTKAKAIIKRFSEFVNNEVESDPEHPQEHTDLWNELCGQAEQFLKGDIRMTDEEIAEKYAKSIVIFDRDFHSYRFAEIEQAYLAGLKAGRPKWHKVADGDLPKNKGAVLSDKGEFVYYNSFAQNLVDETYTEQTDIIAWCEIPKYTEEINYV